MSSLHIVCEILKVSNASKIFCTLNKNLKILRFKKIWAFIDFLKLKKKMFGWANEKLFGIKC